jgi:hypothetical protein
MHIASARFRPTSFRWCRTRCAVFFRSCESTILSRCVCIGPMAESRFCALARAHLRSYRPADNNAGETMELLQLEPPDYGVPVTGIYIIDDDGVAVFAGPFESETAAIGWIDRRQEMLISGSRSETAIY